jgi:hypothetical protein
LKEIVEFPSLKNFKNELVESKIILKLTISESLLKSSSLSYLASSQQQKEHRKDLDSESILPQILGQIFGMQTYLQGMETRS